MAQVELDEFNRLTTDKLRILIKNHLFNVDKFKKMYHERTAMRVEMQKSIEEVKKYKLMLRHKLSAECKNKRLAHKLKLEKKASEKKIKIQKPKTANDKRRKRRSVAFNEENGESKVVKKATASPYDYLEIPDERITCEEAKNIKTHPIYGPENNTTGWFLVSRNNLLMYSERYPTIKEFGYIRRMRVAKPREFESDYYLTLDDFLQLYAKEVTYYDITPEEECVKPQNNTCPSMPTVLTSTCANCKKLYAECGCVSKAAE
jgi:hypothetical protein